MKNIPLEIKNRKASYFLLDLFLTKLEKHGILSDTECDFIKEYVRVSTIGRNEENADQYLLQAKEIWSIIDDRVTILFFSRRKC